LAHFDFLGRPCLFTGIAQNSCQIAIRKGGGFSGEQDCESLSVVIAVEAFSKSANVTLGGNLSISAGPLGRAAETSVALQSAIYSYSRSQGFFAGVSLEGTVVSVRDEANAAYYGKPVTPQEILSDKVTPPAGARNLLQVLSKY